MASLNTLRTKGGVFLTIVIVIALLAFILGDMNGCSQNQNPTIGEINGTKIKLMDFAQERNFEERMNPGESKAEGYDKINDRAWSNLLLSLSYQPGFKTLGLTNSEAELVDMVSGTYLSPVVTSIFRNQETGKFDPQLMAMTIDRLDQQGDYQTWPYLESQMSNEREMSKYSTLVTQGIFLTDLELNMAVTAANKSCDARFVMLPYSQVPDEEVSVTDGEIKKFYNDNKRRYQRSAYRDIEYVSFDVVPSAEDMAAGRQRAEELAAELAVAENPALFVALNSPDDKTPPAFVRESAVDEEIAQALLGNPGAVYGPVLNGETYTASRLAETRMIPDSVNFSIITLMPTEVKLADSLMSVVNRDNFAELAREFSKDDLRSRGGEVGDDDPSMYLVYDAPLGETLIETAVGGISKVTGRSGNIHLIKINNKTKPVRKVKIATVTYVVRPSSATEMAAMNSAREFYNGAQGSYENFRKTATEMALSKKVARINNTERNVNGLENSLELVRWTFDNKKETVSEPISIGKDYIVIAAVTEVAEQGYAPMEEVSSEIRSLLTQRKKAVKLAESLQGDNLDVIAGNLALQIFDANDVMMSSFTLPGSGMEPRIVGAICAAAQTGEISEPVSGNGGVYRFTVTDIREEEKTTAKDEKVRIESMNSYFLDNLIMQTLIEKSNIKDDRILYF